MQSATHIAFVFNYAEGNGGCNAMAWGELCGGVCLGRFTRLRYAHKRPNKKKEQCNILSSESEQSKRATGVKTP